VTRDQPDPAPSTAGGDASARPISTWRRPEIPADPQPWGCSLDSDALASRVGQWRALAAAATSTERGSGTTLLWLECSASRPAPAPWPGSDAVRREHPASRLPQLRRSHHARLVTRHSGRRRELPLSGWPRERPQRRAPVLGGDKDQGPCGSGRHRPPARRCESPRQYAAGDLQAPEPGCPKPGQTVKQPSDRRADAWPGLAGSASGNSAPISPARAATSQVTPPWSLPNGPGPATRWRREYCPGSPQNSQVAPADTALAVRLTPGRRREVRSGTIDKVASHVGQALAAVPRVVAQHLEGAVHVDA
jgi:hypothetical protein